MIRAGLAVIQAIASASEIAIPARRPAARATDASRLSRWMRRASSEWIATQTPARVRMAAFSSMASAASILKPQRAAQVATQMPSRARRSAIS
ncbi:hypothetical protein D3C85_1540810 [compost metagenome]